MHNIIQELKEKIFNNNLITKEDALLLNSQPLETLANAANEIREHFCKNTFDLCTIISGKGGKCSEDCKYCAQSSIATGTVETFSLLKTNDFLKEAQYNQEKNIKRFSIVTSGKKLNKKEIEEICQTIKILKDTTSLTLCASFGLLDKDDFMAIKTAGIERIHNNLESSRKYFPQMCTTHTYEDKIDSIKKAQNLGLSICSGGIFGIGESMEDRIDMAITIRDLGIKSIPINMLNPIPGTPYGNNPRLTIEEMCRIVAIFRFIIPDSFIRLAGGRGLLPDSGKKCFQSGANAAITGDLLTTSGISIETDLKMIKELGFVPELGNC
ncbi:biotin synthase BioB [Fusobacterium sp. PH5-44]|uniref:biotin synthase BioB n=1 Tax=unclassified Fusobacterium TaxID=2648384 RepID=UPI003D1CAEBF